MPAMDDGEQVVQNTITLLRAAQRLTVPIVMSRQYPKGLGDVTALVQEAAGDAPVFDKVEFSCFANQDMRKALGALNRDQFILAGVEAHVCVLQTALELAGEGYQVAVVEDATTSRRPASHASAMERMARRGVDIVTMEMVIFEWLRVAGDEAFKELSSLVR